MIKLNKMEEIKWKMQGDYIRNKRPVGDGDIRKVTLPVQVLFEWSDKIVAEYDYETDTVLKYTSGYIMKVLPGQSALYGGEDSIFLASAFRKR